MMLAAREKHGSATANTQNITGTIAIPYDPTGTIAIPYDPCFCVYSHLPHRITKVCYCNKMLFHLSVCLSLSRRKSSLVLYRYKSTGIRAEEEEGEREREGE